MSYVARHITLRAASIFIAANHRHHQPPQGCIAAISAWDGVELVAVATIGRPVARMLQDGETAEITRVCAALGHRNACSFIMTKAKRLAQAWGFTRVITYTLPSEGGASLRASGFVCEGEAGGGSWSVPSRPRTDKAPTEVKWRWVA